MGGVAVLRCRERSVGGRKFREAASSAWHTLAGALLVGVERARLRRIWGSPCRCPLCMPSPKPARGARPLRIRQPKLAPAARTVDSQLLVLDRTSGTMPAGL